MHSLKAKLIINTLLLSLLILEVNAQNFQTRLSEIEQTTDKINNSLDSFRKVTIENDEMEDITGLVGYFKNDQIQKIELSIKFTYGIKDYDFYYENTQLIYVKEILYQYIWINSKETFDYTKTERIFRGDYIFKGQFDLITLGHHRFEEEETDIAVTLKNKSEECKKKLVLKL